MKSCLICDKGFDKRVVGIRQYCNTCRPFVREIQENAHRLFKSGDTPSARAFECVDCGQPASDWDHRYYSMPSEVDPVCSRCNTNRGPALDVRQLTRDLMGIFNPPEPPKVRHVDYPHDLNARMDQLEKQYILSALAEARHNKTKAAKMLGITFRSLRYRLDRLQIES